MELGVGLATSLVACFFSLLGGISRLQRCERVSPSSFVEKKGVLKSRCSQKGLFSTASNSGAQGFISAPCGTRSEAQTALSVGTTLVRAVA